MMACPGSAPQDESKSDAGHPELHQEQDLGRPVDIGVPDLGRSDLGTPDFGALDSGAPDRGNKCDLDTDPPTISAIQGSSIDLPPDARTYEVQFEFSERVVIEDGFSVDNGAVIEAVADLGGNTFEVRLSAMASGVTYTLLAGTSILDACQNALEEPLKTMIRVGVDPCAADVDGPTATFSESPVYLGGGTSTVSVAMKLDEPVVSLEPDDFSVDSGATVDSVVAVTKNHYVIMITGLQVGATTLAIEKSVQDYCGNSVESGAAKEIFKNDTPPEVLMTSPPSGAWTSAFTSSVSVTFSEPVVASTGTVTLSAAGGYPSSLRGPVPFRVEWTAEGTALSVHPTAPGSLGGGAPDIWYPLGSIVTLTLSGFLDLYGNSIPSYSLSFETDSCPAFSDGPDIESIDVIPNCLQGDDR